MNDKISRRKFFEKSAQAGVSVTLGSAAISNILDSSFTEARAQESPDIAVVTGEDYFKNTIKAVELLGGMEKFVPKNSRVAILPNVQRWHPGTYTSPEIVRAVVQMCKKAGAKEINCLSQLPERNWKETGIAAVLEEEGANLIIVDRSDEKQFRKIPVPKGKMLKEAEIMEKLFENDVFINLPITKDHAGNKFTGTLKNMMGINSGKNNRTFHKDDWKTNKDSIAFLDNCIADLNTVVKPDLGIVDATEFIITNGPMGPGELSKPQKIVAGVDRIAVDAYCTTLFGMKGSDIVMINKGFEHKLGQIDLKKVNIKEV